MQNIGIHIGARRPYQRTEFGMDLDAREGLGFPERSEHAFESKAPPEVHITRDPVLEAQV